MMSNGAHGPRDFILPGSPEWTEKKARSAAAARGMTSPANQPHLNIIPRAKSAADLQGRVFAPVKYVVPGYVAEGATILAGRPKIGKSWLALEMAYAVATGGDCLGGIECERGEVLYLGLEDNERRLQSRLERIAGAGRWPSSLHYATEWARAGSGGTAGIEAWLLEHPSARLVVIDVLEKFRDPRDPRKGIYEGDFGDIGPLQKLAMRHNVAIVFVHHIRKGKNDSGDPFEKVSGSLGLSGAADTTLVLDGGGAGVTLYGRGRDIPEIETAVRFDKEACRWSAIGDAAEVRVSDERGKVLRALKEAPEPMTPTEISDFTGMTSAAVRKLLSKMTRAGEVLKSGRGLYVHPSRADIVTAPLTEPGHNGHKVTTDDKQSKNNGLNCDPYCDRPTGPVTRGNHNANEDDSLSKPIVTLSDERSQHRSQTNPLNSLKESGLCDLVTVVTTPEKAPGHNGASKRKGRAAGQGRPPGPLVYHALPVEPFLPTGSTGYGGAL